MPLVVYSALRLALFAAALGVLWWVGMGGWLAVVVAALIAGAMSYVVLARPRDAAARWLAERAESRRRTGQRFPAGVEADAAAEDAEVDARTELTTSQREPDAQQHPVAELEQPGTDQYRPQQHPTGAEQHGPGEQSDRQGEQQHQQ